MRGVDDYWPSGGMSMRRHDDAVFDDTSPYVDRFGLLLIVTVASVVMLALFDVDRVFGDVGDRVGSVGTSVLVSATLLLALRASGISQRWWRVAQLVVLAFVVLLVVAALAPLDSSTSATYAPPAVLVVLAALAPIVVVRRLLHHRVITTGTLQGAIAAYLLIPIAFFYAFQAVNSAAATPFFGHAEPTTSFMYFSLSTITTLGYGDLSVAGNLGRLLATSEAIVGQIYLVTFVAMIVGLLAQRRSPPPASESDKQVGTDG
jgi:hypothetical protein